MGEFPSCKVDFILNNNSVYAFDPELNEAQIAAISISKTVYAGNRYYDIESISYNSQNDRLEIRLKE